MPVNVRKGSKIWPEIIGLRGSCDDGGPHGEVRRARNVVMLVCSPELVSETSSIKYKEPHQRVTWSDVPSDLILSLKPLLLRQ